MARRLAEVRKSGELAYLRPDGKTQVTVEYERGVPKAVRTVVVSSQHDPDVSAERIRADIIEHVIRPTVPAELRVKDPVMHVNPTGRFVTGGPMGDAGLTGRKIIVDTYGGMARHGGGAFSGKDPTKVDRSAAYAARWVAKNVVAAGLASRFEVEVAYGIGIAKPISFSVESFGTGRIPDEQHPGAHRAGSSTCGRAPSSSRSTCSGPSTSRPPHTATSAAPTSTCRGSGPTRQSCWPRQPASATSSRRLSASRVTPSASEHGRREPQDRGRLAPASRPTSTYRSSERGTLRSSRSAATWGRSRAGRWPAAP